VLPVMEKNGPVEAWIVDETGWAKQGTHSVGVAPQYCGRLKRKANCQVAVSLSVATASASLPIAFRLYLTEQWATDEARREAVGVPQAVSFQTKPEMALSQIRQAVEDKVAPGVVLADEIYGSVREFREGVAALNLNYSLAVRCVTTVWTQDRGPLPPKKWSGKGRRAQRMQRDETHQPVTVEQLARTLPQKAWKTVRWREGSKGILGSRFAAVRVQPAYGDDRKIGRQPEQWLLIEWPKEEAAPLGYWLSNLPDKTSLRQLVAITKQRWLIERDYEELKQEVGLSHYEGRNWRGFHHHVTLCIAAYGFLVAERSRFSPSAKVGHLGLRTPRIPTDFRRRGSPGSRTTA
jgi:SRSO17 transposase